MVRSVCIVAAVLIAGTTFAAESPAEKALAEIRSLAAGREILAAKGTSIDEALASQIAAVTALRTPTKLVSTHSTGWRSPKCTCFSAAE